MNETLPSEAPTSASKPWDSLGLSDEALRLIEKAGFTQPTPVQTAAIPLALEGKDVIASAQTGTGKTATFVLPMVERFAGREGTYGLILCPTREIAQQTQQTLELFGTPRGIRSIVLIGGINMRIDAAALATYPQIIVATPGRLCDHLDRGNVWLDFIEMVVLDEADRMLDMGFSDQLNRIMSEVPDKRQTLLFSATIPPAVEKLAHRILHEPEKVTIGRPVSAAVTVEQRFLFMQEDAKARELRKLLREEPGSIIVFTRSKDGATRVWRSLHSAGVYDATYIHSDRLQAHREQALAEFKEGKFRIMIATDVAARGIHVDGVAHVVNYDLPYEAEDYIHRIGRTGRAGQTGKSTSFVTPRDRVLIRQIEKILGRKVEPENRDFEREGEGRHGGGGRGDGRRGEGRRGDGRHGEGRRDEKRANSAQNEATTGEAPEAAESDQRTQPRQEGAASSPTTSGDEQKRKRRRRRGGRGRRGKGGAPGAAPGGNPPPGQES